MRERARGARRVGLALAFACGAALAEPAARDPVRLSYDAPPGCPGPEQFLAAVRARAGTDWEAPPGVFARALDVRVAAARGSAVARLSFTDAGGRPASRAIAATTCDEVVAAMALVTVLAIESRLDPDPDDGAAAAPVPVDPPATPPAAVAPPAEPVAPPPPVVPAPPPAPPPPVRRDAERGWVVDLGVAGVTGSGVGPVMAYGVRGAVGVTAKGGASIRAGVDALWSGSVSRAGASAAFSAVGARLSGCPFAVELSDGLGVAPCGALNLGGLHGETRESPTIRGGGATTLQVAPEIAARLRLEVGPLVIEVEPGVRFPVDHHRFFVTAGGRRADVFRVPFAAAGVAAGVGLRL